MPKELHNLAAWDSFLSKLKAPPAWCATQLPALYTPQPLVPTHNLSQPPALAEIEVGLQQLHNGRLGALHGHTSKLLRYAKLVATPDDQAPLHLLAPCLVVLCNAAFSTGQVPPLKNLLDYSSLQRTAMPPKQPTTGQSQWVS